MTRLTGRRLFSFRAFAVNVGVVAVAFFAGLLLDLRFWGLSLLTQWRLIVVLLLVVSVPSYYTFWVSTTLLRWTAAKRLSLVALTFSCMLVAGAISAASSPFFAQMGFTYYSLAYRIVYGASSGNVVLQMFHSLTVALLAIQTAKGFAAAVWAPWSPFLILYPVLSLLKAGRWLVQPIITVLCERLYESKQGVLSQVGLGVAALAKIVQESLKHLGYLTVH